MNLQEMTIMGFSNLWRTRLRSSLTIIGVVIGIGALTSMVSFGTGLQKNVTDAFRENDLFTSMNVTPKKFNVEEMMGGDVSGLAEMLEGDPEPLTDSILFAIRAMDHVEIAFPEETFAGKLKLNGKEISRSIQPFPAAMRRYSPYNELLAGEFYSSDTSHTVVIRWEALKDLGLIMDYPDLDYTLSKEDSIRGVRIITADSVIGKEIILVTASLNDDFPRNPLSILMKRDFEPFQEQERAYTICGVVNRSGEFSFDRFRGGLMIPEITAREIPRLNFSSIWDILGDSKDEGTYASIYVRVDEMEELTEVRKQIEAMGVGVFAIADQLQEIKRGFLIMDSLLGAIGTIALIIAALGIINTMLMSILERTREIGIMKAVGGSENEIKFIFFIEAACIGFVGAIFGLMLGWVVTRIANQVMNTVILPADQEYLDLFYFPLWLIFGAVAFSIVISLAAGLYPAIRAARIDPVRALRHD
ncbi:MAG TPA: ABC transporter permease [Bacteroides sp.]|nr:ABC transporter permease [Bacteroides sp.]